MWFIYLHFLSDISALFAFKGGKGYEGHTHTCNYSIDILYVIVIHPPTPFLWNCI